MKAVTMKDIAQAMGISVVSVSKALGGKSGVSEELRENVLKKAHELGYMYAGIPAAGIDLYTVGILVADHFFTDSSFYSNMYRSLLLECSDKGHSCILEIVTREAEENGILPNILTGQKCNGIIFMGEFSDSYIQKVTNTDIPHILLDSYSDKNNNDSIISDGLSGTFLLTSYLIEQGHKKIAFVGSVLATSSILDRYLGYYKALLKNGIALNEEWILPDRGADGRFVDIELPENMPEAFVCNCDEVAYRMLIKLKREGYDVPNDVSIVGFDNYRFATLSEPPLTTYSVDVASMAKVSISRLLRKMSHAPYTKGCAIISGAMVIRNSTKKR